MVHADVHLKAILRVGFGRVTHTCGMNMTMLFQYLIRYIHKILMKGEKKSVFHYREQNSFFAYALSAILLTALTSKSMYWK
jgi:hypothetical protein